MVNRKGRRATGIPAFPLQAVDATKRELVPEPWLVILVIHISRGCMPSLVSGSWIRERSRTPSCLFKPVAAKAFFNALELLVDQGRAGKFTLHSRSRECLEVFELGTFRVVQRPPVLFEDQFRAAAIHEAPRLLSTVLNVRLKIGGYRRAGRSLACRLTRYHGRRACPGRAGRNSRPLPGAVIEQLLNGFDEFATCVRQSIEILRFPARRGTMTPAVTEQGAAR